MNNNAMFDTSKIYRATGRKPRCFNRLVLWWRRIIKRDRYYIGVDKSYDNSPDFWSESKVDTKTGVITVLRTGRGKPPENNED